MVQSVSRRCRNRCWSFGVVLAPLIVVAGLFFAPAAGAATGEITIRATNSPQLSGSPVNYVINVQCSAVLGGEDCGEEPTIRIPLDEGTIPPMGAGEWKIAATGQPGLIVKQEQVGSEYVIVLRDGIQPGSSSAVQLSVTPPNGTTPDETSWELQPTLESSDITLVQAPEPAPGEAEAETKLTVTKDTSDGGAVYVSGNTVTYDITARCNAGFPSGSLYMTDAKLVDDLPPEATFVSADPEPTTAPAVGSTGQIVWEFENPGTMPPGCVEGAGGTANYQVVVEIPATVPNNTVLTNTVTLSGTPIGGAEIEEKDEKELTAISTPPANPGEFIAKSAAAPLNIPDEKGGERFLGTYAGHWITPTNPTPSSANNAAEGHYTVEVNYPASRAFETDLVDPMPCLGEKNGVEYPSMPVEGDVEGPASAPVCSEPAFHPTVVGVTSASMPTAVAENWTINLIPIVGPAVAIPASSSEGTSAYFEVPAGLVGKIAAIELPPDVDLTDVSMTVDVWGYADESVPPGSDLHDIAVGTAYPIGTPTPSRTAGDSADIYVEPNLVQLGVRKAFGSVGGGTGGTTTMTIGGSITIPPAYTLPGPVVLADLLPAGLQWANPPAGGEGAFTLRPSSGSSTTVNAVVENIPNFSGSGRELIRISLPAVAFAEPGFYTIEAAESSFFGLRVPSGARTYNNEANIFVAGIGRQTSTLCGTGGGTKPANLESSDPLDLDGDGVVEENYCMAKAELKTPAEGPAALSMEKLVRGDLDPLPQRSPAVGHSKPGGTAEYTLNWANTGGEALDEPVIYDILPYVGDAGVSESEAGTARDSEFAVHFVSVGGLPKGMSVEYSESTDPCRSEVYPTNPGCDEDWSATAPDPSAVRALRFISSATYQPGESFSLTFTVRLPPGEVNTVAWNSAATRADSGGESLLPAEPPKVGITAEAQPVTPTLRTAVSAAEVAPGTAFHDALQIAGTGSYAGELEWKLLGPVEANGADTCEGVDWSDAAVLADGTIATTADGTYPTPLSAPTAEGCYGYEATLDGSGFTGPVTSPAGSAGEVVLVRTPPTPPSPPKPPPVTPHHHAPHLVIVKKVSAERAVVGRPVRYTIAVRNTGAGAAADVVVTDRPVSRMAFVAAEPSKGTCGKGFPLRCGIGTIAPGGRQTVKVTARPLAVGAIVNSATVRAKGVHGKAVKAQARAKAVAPLRLIKTASSRIVRAGHAFRYTIAVTNPTAAPVLAARVCDRLPAGIVYRHSSARTRLHHGSYCWTLTLPAHATRKILVAVRALPGSTGKLLNVARLSGPNVLARRATATVRVKPRPTPAGGVTG
jgi:uncharacterized repeat protein (TIGR01451 family)